MTSGTALWTSLIGEDQPRFVFLHGLFGQGRNWTTIAKQLLPHTSLLVDLPNHGRSPWTTRFDHEEMAQAVADLLTGLKQPICLVGHSMGGRTAMRVALRHPELVERLVVEDTSPEPLSMAEFAIYARALADLPLDRLTTRGQAREILRPRIRDERVLNFLLQNLQPTPGAGWHWQMNLTVLARDMAEIGAWPPVETQFDKPVLWITGTASTRTANDRVALMRSYFPQVVHSEVAGAGHWVHADAVHQFVTLVRDFA